MMKEICRVSNANMYYRGIKFVALNFITFSLILRSIILKLFGSQEGLIRF